MRAAMVRAVWFCRCRQQVLLITAHHLVVDVVSWHIMLGGVAEAWRSVQSEVAPNPPKTLPEFTSYRRWSELMWARAATPEVTAQREYWIAQVDGPDPELGVRHPDPARDTWSTLRVTAVATPVGVTERLLATLSRDQGVREFLLAATTLAVASWRRERAQDPAVGHAHRPGRAGPRRCRSGDRHDDTVGWFTTAFPVRLGVGAAAVDVEQAEQDPLAARALLESVVTHTREIPYEGLDYGLLRYVDANPRVAGRRPADAVQLSGTSGPQRHHRSAVVADHRARPRCASGSTPSQTCHCVSR